MARKTKNTKILYTYKGWIKKMNYNALKKNSTENLKKLLESAIADKKLYEKKIKLD